MMKESLSKKENAKEKNCSPRVNKASGKKGVKEKLQISFKDARVALFGLVDVSTCIMKLYRTLSSEEEINPTLSKFKANLRVEGAKESAIIQLIAVAKKFDRFTSQNLEIYPKNGGINKKVIFSLFFMISPVCRCYINMLPCCNPREYPDQRL